MSALSDHKNTVIKFATVIYTSKQQAIIEELERDLDAHMRLQNPKRFAHSISVGHMAETMAVAYGIDPYPARVAGILHDWEKGLSNEDTLLLAEKYQLEMGVAYEKIISLLHGPLAAHELPKLYPWLSKEILSAIAKHTTADLVMSDLDKIIYVADLIEPLRASYPGIVRSRELFVRHVSLEALYRASFTSTLLYVVESGKYLYPKSVDIYNAMIGCPLKETESDVTKRTER